MEIKNYAHEINTYLKFLKSWDKNRIHSDGLLLVDFIQFVGWYTKTGRDNLLRKFGEDSLLDNEIVPWDIIRYVWQFDHVRHKIKGLVQEVTDCKSNYIIKILSIDNKVNLIREIYFTSNQKLEINSSYIIFFKKERVDNQLESVIQSYHYLY